MNEFKYEKLEYGLGNRCNFYLLMSNFSVMEMYLLGVRQVKCSSRECYEKRTCEVQSFWEYQAQIAVIQLFINECS